MLALVKRNANDNDSKEPIDTKMTPDQVKEA
jgi:hypothetical protein